MNETNLTANEIEPLKSIRDDDFQDGAYPVGNHVWSNDLNCSLSRRSIPGVMASLSKKNMVECQGSGKEATVCITQAGFDAIK